MADGCNYDEHAQECRECGEVYYGEAAEFLFRCAACDGCAPTEEAS